MDLVTNLALPALLLTALAACGEDDGAAEGGLEGFEAFTVTGELGEEPEVAWKGRLEADEPEEQTLIEGGGEPVEDGVKVLLNYYIGNGFTQEKAFSTHDEGETAEAVDYTPDELGPVFGAALEGATVGSRVAVIASADEAFGEGVGNPALGIGNKDTVLVIIDVESTVLDGPDEGPEAELPPWAPRIVEEDGEPTSLDFSRTPQPNERLRSTVLIEGDGAVVQDGDLVFADYLGQTYDGRKPFDQSFGKEPFQTTIGQGNVIKGWDRTIVGQPVGSRILIQVPPEFGYGKAGQGEDISGDDTLFFVIDVLATG